jgi:hypothetical protein
MKRHFCFKKLVSRKSVIAEVRLQSKISVCWVSGGVSDNGTGLFRSTSVFPASIILTMFHFGIFVKWPRKFSYRKTEKWTEL